jgi:hypothetical protein
MRWSFEQRSWARPIHARLLYCMYHGNEINHRTKDCPIYIGTKQKMNQDTTQPLPQLQSREDNHTMQWSSHNPQHSSSYPLHYPTQAYQNSNPVSSILPIIPLCHHQPSSTSASSINTPCQTIPMPTNSKPSQTHRHPHLHNKLRNLRNKSRIFPPMAPYLQSPEVQTQTLRPKGSAWITIAKLTMLLSKVPLL